MSFTIKCYTLFDITQTGVINRSKPGLDEDPVAWQHKRNTQCNFDTVLQVISLRSQPEVLNTPEKISVKFEEFGNFGFVFDSEEDEQPCWTFEFSVQHDSVFDDGIDKIGYLYSDCDRVPMVLCGTEWSKLSNFLDCSSELKNIHFEIK